MQPTISAGYLFMNNAHLIWESLCKEELSHYDSFVEWSAIAPSEKVPPPPTAAEIYAKIVEKNQVLQFLAGINPDFEYARVHLLDWTPFSTLDEVHTYCLSDQSRRSPMPPISGIPSETYVMDVRYAYLVPPSVPSQTSQTSSPSLSPLPAASGNSRPPSKKCDYCDSLFSSKTKFQVLHLLQALFLAKFLDFSVDWFPDHDLNNMLHFDYTAT
ncbi:hypothetical protein GIB67_008627 [Kingdonia uniflora]|uniref:Uncharacterized protein n=1 Tax=Kingdonia uniflora TaxID=39325 RepID=A0A7J7M4W6_9MAGN|nr:hypothetical protein GIB67_008627 [Kingdonia uniflora]